MAHAYNLKEFQESLARRLREAHAAPMPDSRLAVTCGRRQWLLRLDQVGEILPLSVTGGRITPVPLTQPWYAGLANVRGKLVSVADLGLFAGEEPIVLTPTARIVLVAERYQFHCALLVERMVGLRNRARFTEAGVTDLPDGPAWQGSRLRDSDGGLWQELDVGVLINDETFRHAGLPVPAGA